MSMLTLIEWCSSKSGLLVITNTTYTNLHITIYNDNHSLIVAKVMRVEQVVWWVENELIESKAEISPFTIVKSELEI